MQISKIEAVIFDMDGVLIDSEPSWQQAELEVFNALGLNLTLADTKQTTGLRIDQVVSYWHQRRPWANYNNSETTQQISERMVATILQSGTPLKGVLQALAACKQSKLKIGLATSSPQCILEAVLTRLDIRQHFDAIESAEGLRYGKPHPEVYLNCATQLNIEPHLCLAIEDSYHGLISARAANMQTIVIPAPEDRGQARWILAHAELNDLDELATQLLNKS